MKWPESVPPAPRITCLWHLARAFTPPYIYWPGQFPFFLTTLAFWLRSSVVSVLKSIIAFILPPAGQVYYLIFDSPWWDLCLHVDSLDDLAIAHTGLSRQGLSSPLSSVVDCGLLPWVKWRVIRKSWFFLFFIYFFLYIIHLSLVQIYKFKAFSYAL